MKIIPNLTSLIKAYYALKYLTEHKKEIEQARAAGDIEREKQAILEATTTWGKKLAALFGATITVYGKENLPKKGPVLYISNHQAAADIVVLCAALDSIQFSFITKAELAKVPLYGKWIDRVRAIFLMREDPRSSLQSIKNGIEYLEMGFSLLVFPEGTRSRGIKMGEFKPGAFKLATKPGVPIVPVTINGTYRTYEDTGIMTGAPVQVMLHPAIATKGLTRDQERDLPDQVKAVIQEGLDKLVALENKSQ
jgi:1-acyl-sn-glycerol-3-phosphate acyltransferase